MLREQLIILIACRNNIKHSIERFIKLFICFTLWLVGAIIRSFLRYFLLRYFSHLFHRSYLSPSNEQMKVFGDNNIGDKYHKENIEATADQQSPSAARRLARLVGFVLGAEGRRSSKTRCGNIAGAPSFVRRPVLPDRVSPARSAWSSGLARGTRKGRA